MALAEPTTAEQESHAQAHVAGSSTEANLVVCLGPSYLDCSAEQVADLLPNLRTAESGRILVGYPVTRGDAAAEERDGVVLQPFVEVVHAKTVILQTAAAWINAHELVRAHNARCCLLLGADAESLQPEALRSLVAAVCEQGVDLAVPQYEISSTQSLLNAAVLSPLSRALFHADLQFPLTLDVACSARMSERMAGAAQRFTTAGQEDAIVWPVSEAAVAGFSFAEVAAGPREVPQTTDDLGIILNRVAGSMFSDIEAKAAFWQRTRPASPVQRFGTQSAQAAHVDTPTQEEIAGLIDSFRNGYSNLHELWSMVLPPNTLVTLKRLSTASVQNFQLPDAVWVRIVYDFVLAHRLRTISRNHLMGAFAPLYLAWVASHLAHSTITEPTKSLARAFEADKPYLVSRWRWPDRFNP